MPLNHTKQKLSLSFNSNFMFNLIKLFNLLFIVYNIHNGWIFSNFGVLNQNRLFLYFDLVISFDNLSILINSSVNALDISIRFRVGMVINQMFLVYNVGT